MSPLSKAALLGAATVTAAAVFDTIIELHQNGGLPLGTSGRTLVVVAIAAWIMAGWCYLRDTIVLELRTLGASKWLRWFGINSRENINKKSSAPDASAGEAQILRPDFGHLPNRNPEDHGSSQGGRLG